MLALLLIALGIIVVTVPAVRTKVVDLANQLVDFIKGLFNKG